MEKVVYLLLGPAGSVGDDLGDELRGDCVARMRSGGARSVQVNVVAGELGPPFGVDSAAEGGQILAAVSAWVDSAESAKVASALPDPGGSGTAWHGWLVTESEPRPNRTRPPAGDGRIPGFAQLVALRRPSGLRWAEWRSLWQGPHVAVATNAQATFRYVQNVVLRALTPSAPDFAGIGEECFPTEAASDIGVFFASGGDEARLARHMAAMSDSCDRFMDSVMPVSWTNEWVYP